MKRPLVVAAVALALAGTYLHTATSRDREYRRLLAEGEKALATDQTFVAIEAFSGALALKSDSVVAHLKRGETYRRRGQLGEALRDLQTAARLDPSATRPLEQLGDVNYETGRYTRAAERYVEYIRLDDSSARVFYKLGLSHFRSDNTPAAMSALRQALALDAKSAEARYLLGACLRIHGDNRAARRELDRAIELSPALIAAREELIDLARDQRDEAEVLTQLEALVTLEPARPERRLALGLEYARVGRTDLAVTTLARALERGAGGVAIYVGLGRVWLQAAEERNDRVALNKAIAALRDAIARAMPTSEAYTLLGRAQMLAGDPGAARRALQRAVATYPVDPNAFATLADVCERTGDFGLARMALSRHVALRREPASRDIVPLVRLARLALRADDVTEAIQWFERAAEADPGNSAVQHELAAARRRVADPRQ